MKKTQNTDLYWLCFVLLRERAEDIVEQQKGHNKKTVWVLRLIFGVVLTAAQRYLLQLRGRGGIELRPKGVEDGIRMAMIAW